ncbi:ATP-binding protein [Bradyrhizobium sp. CB1717]|nr:ATP-binding protein [Bradyrhizobium sp. CB1717]WFU26860.1 ATP-binding protein [Bradyrhizobium sp. CB1717]
MGIQAPDDGRPHRRCRGSRTRSQSGLWPRAFDAFSRAEVSRSRQLGGAGLGLSVVRAIAEAHNVRATYKASATGGSIFEIILPFNGVNDAAPSRSMQP